MTSIHVARAILATLAATLLGAVAACQSAPASSDTASLVLTGGNVVTMDAGRPQGEAVAVRGDRILAVGTAQEIRRHVGRDTEIIDLAGRLVIPGFIETHGHFVQLGEARMILDLTTARTWHEMVQKVGDAARTAPPGAWIRGRGWHQERWTTVPEPSVDGVPVHASLSAVTPNNPVLLTHASGHASIANARALDAGGIVRNTANPSGGTIVRDRSGEATGLLRETAQRLLDPAIARAQQGRPEADVAAEFRERVRLAGEDALSKGVTSFQDAGSSFSTIDRLKSMAEAGELPVRLYVMVRRERNDAMAARLAQYKMIGAANHFLTVRAIKRQIDGALGSHGAWLLDPYADLPSTAGLVLEPVAEIEETARIALQHGYQLNTHAIGDRANREVLNLYQRAFHAAGVQGTDVRWRIEHAQHLHPADISRFRELGVIAAMQGVHATSDGPWVPDRIGDDRARTGAYVWRSLLDAGTVLANGTDAPVENLDPIPSFYASVSRRLADGRVFYGDQRMTREEALRSYTLAAAYAAFEEDLKGSLIPGKLADLVVLSKDILTVPEAEILTTRVDLTILGGQVRYRAPAR
jgi:predicted amidohydrolase YtcJ